MFGSISECFSYTWMIWLASPVQDYCPEKEYKACFRWWWIDLKFVSLCVNVKCITVSSHFQTSPYLFECMSLILKLFHCYNYLLLPYRAAQRVKESLYDNRTQKLQKKYECRILHEETQTLLMETANISSKIEKKKEYHLFHLMNVR